MADNNSAAPVEGGSSASKKRRRKAYLGPDVSPNTNLPRTTAWLCKKCKDEYTRQVLDSVEDGLDNVPSSTSTLPTLTMQCSVQPLDCTGSPFQEDFQLQSHAKLRPVNFFSSSVQCEPSNLHGQGTASESIVLPEHLSHITSGIVPSSTEVIVAPAQVFLDPLVCVSSREDLSNMELLRQSPHTDDEQCNIRRVSSYYQSEQSEKGSSSSNHSEGSSSSHSLPSSSDHEDSLHESSSEDTIESEDEEYDNEDVPHHQDPDGNEAHGQNHGAAERDNEPPVGEGQINLEEENAEGRDHHEQQTHQYLRRRMQEDFEPPIDTPVDVSRNDALYMALGLARRENFTNVAFCNSVKLINALFASPVLPPTISILDSLLVSNRGVRYYFFCKVCFESFGELDFKNVKFHICPGCQIRNPISDLRIAHFFVIFDVVYQLQNLLQNDVVLDALLTPAEAVARRKPGFICDIWDGSVYQTFAANVANVGCRLFSFHFSVDGSPLAVSSLSSIWPIQLALNELPPILRMTNLLLGGLWFGQKHARMDLFLDPFVAHFRELSEGFNIKIGRNVEQARAYCLACCADPGARGQVQGVKAHGGYHLCNWCTIAGEWIGHHVKFPLRMERPPDRTHEELVRLQTRLVNEPLPEEDDPFHEEEEVFEDPGIAEHERELLGVNAVSPLINLPYFERDDGSRVPSFNMVDGFFVDSMHMMDLGISKFFLNRWMDDYGYDYYIKNSETDINKRIRALRPPLEFRRMPREMKERSRFKARELQNWLMFCSIPVLTGILRDKFLKSWLILIQALYLINQEEVSMEDLDIADTLITQFLVETQDYYGDSEITFNLHILKHLTAHVRRNGQPWASSAFCFEDGNGRLKGIIHSNLGIPHQVIRALSWNESSKILETVVSAKAKEYVSSISQPKQHRQRSMVVGNDRLVGKPQPKHLTAEELYQCEENGHREENLDWFKKVIHRNCAFTDNSHVGKTDNSMAQLLDKSIVLIRKIGYDRDFFACL